MKIFYAVQATGNGHISRAMELLPYLKKYAEVDVFLSGANSQLNAALPVRYRSKGLSLFYNNNGGLSYAKIIRSLQPLRVWNEVKELPVEKYDIVINDFECITSLACAYKRIPSVNLGHQASFRSVYTPRPAKKDAVGEYILAHFGRATAYMGLHFEAYDDFIFTPVIKKEILRAKPVSKAAIAVYLPAYSDESILKHFGPLKPFRFQVFSKRVSHAFHHENIYFLPISNRVFTESMVNCAGIVTGAGFETPAEALHLQKKLMVIPIRGQYEQQCNAAALEQLGVKTLQTLDSCFSDSFYDWMETAFRPAIQYNDIAQLLTDRLLEDYPYRGSALDLLQPGFMLN